jgi:SAM-dependent MidA family methyltransferase
MDQQANTESPALRGHPDLVASITEEIRASGPITFARFMELALYHPRYGYYTRCESMADAYANTPRVIGEDRIGWGGDYFTSSDVHPALAQALARQVRQMDVRLGRPDPLTVIEMGAGKGTLARDFLTACAKESGGVLDRLRYVILERSPAMQAAQRAALAPWLSQAGRVTWVGSLDAWSAGSLVGVVFSNELVDAFPVHRIRILDGEPKEVYVDCQDGRFCERVGPLSIPTLKEYLHQLDLSLPDGYMMEVNLEARVWMKRVAQVLGRGFVITIDYGHTARDLYHPDRQRGTLLCYYRHRVSEDPYTRVGLQDITAHVDFTSLATVGEESGLHVTGFTNQISFLMGLGIEQLLESLDAGSAEFQSAVQLLRPEGMGRTFKVLIQHKGVAEPQLDGLRFRPFFGEALTQAMGNWR